MVKIVLSLTIKRTDRKILINVPDIQFYATEPVKNENGEKQGYTRKKEGIKEKRRASRKKRMSVYTGKRKNEKKGIKNPEGHFLIVLNTS